MSISFKFIEYMKKWQPIKYEDAFFELAEIIDKELQELEVRIMERLGYTSTVDKTICKCGKIVDMSTGVFNEKGIFSCKECYENQNEVNIVKDGIDQCKKNKQLPEPPIGESDIIEDGADIDITFRHPWGNSEDLMTYCKCGKAVKMNYSSYAGGDDFCCKDCFAKKIPPIPLEDETDILDELTPSFYVDGSIDCYKCGQNIKRNKQFEVKNEFLCKKCLLARFKK